MFKYILAGFILFNIGKKTYFNQDIKLKFSSNQLILSQIGLSQAIELDKVLV